MLNRFPFRLFARLLRAVETAALLAIARLLVKFVPFRHWRGMLGPIQSDAQAESQPDWDEAETKRAKAIGRRVRRMAARVPFEAVCLPQAMAARWMLRIRGVETQLYLGAKIKEDKPETALHAWLVHGEHCLTGGSESDSFVAFSR